VSGPVEESTFTAAREDCPHPERWSSYDEQATELEVIDLAAALVRALQPDVVIETGTYHGHMALRLGMALAMNGQGCLVTMEPDPERHARAVSTVGDDLPVHVLQRESLSVSCDEIRAITSGHVGFAWFDSLFELRAREFEHFLPLLDARTIVGFHDAGPQHGDWSNELRNHPRLAVIDLPTPRGCLLGQVLD
jgi:predicted O-methyltransferase YrrM